MSRAPRQWVWWLAAAVLIALAATQLLRGGGSTPSAPVSVAEGPTRAASPAPARKVYVHVAGRVRRPGLYRLPSGSRVATALDRAGGAAHHADLTKVNLAARVEDGQQIVVPELGAAPVAAGATAGGGSAGAKVSLASATAEQLDALDGIGPTLAKRIVSYRDSHGGFRSVGQLRDVEGIGEKRFEALRKAVGP
jgi:competence protein ComEA